MYKFKTSKYKNAVGKLSKKEDWITDLPIGSAGLQGSLITASAAFVAFHVVETGSESVGILPLDFKGKLPSRPPLLQCHSDKIADFAFSVFDDGLLATGSHDCTVKLWRIPKELDGTTIFNSEVTLSNTGNKIEILAFHPTVNNLLTSTSQSALKLWDLVEQKETYCFSKQEEIIQSISWRSNGSTIATASKDKLLRIIDPRADTVQTTAGHKNGKDVQILWLGDSDRILSTGFNSSWHQHLCIHDIRNFAQPLKTKMCDSTSGIQLPFFDFDTKMLFLAGKGDASVSFMEIMENEPYVTEASKLYTESSTRSACLVPKRAMNVMQAEVNRLLQLTSNSIVPISYLIPRKSYYEFHSDLFPDTDSAEPALVLSEWLSGITKNRKKLSLDPAKHSEVSLVRFSNSIKDNNKAPNEIADELNLSSQEKNQHNENFQSDINGATQHQIMQDPSDTGNTVSEIAEKITKQLTVSQDQQINFKINESMNKQSEKDLKVSASKRERGTFKPFAGFRVSKYRHLKGTLLHESQHITNISDFNTSLPGECDGIHANKQRIAVPLNGIGGRIAILELSKTGRLPDGLLPVIQNGSTILDFCWDPFDDSRLAVACDDGTIRIWLIPPGGLVESKNEPDAVIQGFNEKTCIIKFHPLAQDILLTASHHFTVHLWSLNESKEKFQFQGHKDKIFNIAWSPDGKYFASVCKDKKIRIFNPRMSSDSIQEGPGPSGSRGARIAWVVQGNFLLVSGFDKACERLVNMHNTEDINIIVTSIQLDTSPSILVPYYEEDSNTVFLTGKGDSTIYTYETIGEAPYLFPLSHHKCPNVHQGITLLPKLICNIKNVEFARILRLVGIVLEPIAFTVPRVKMELFQDDLFPDSRVTWEPTMSSEEWLSGLNKAPSRISWMPEGMLPVTEKSASFTSTGVSIIAEKEKQLSEMSTKEKEKEIAKAISDRIQFSTTLPQDEMEGVDPDEWNE